MKSKETKGLTQIIDINYPLASSILNVSGVYLNLGKKTPVSQNVKPKTRKEKSNISNEDKVADSISGIEHIEVQEGFAQIECNATKEQIMHYFMSLANEKNDSFNKCYMAKRDVEEFVKKNFAIFKCLPTGKYFPINLTISQKGRLRRFVSEFNLEFGLKTVSQNRNYALLLIHNFEIFKDDKLDSLVNNMQLKKGPVEKNRIPVPTKK